MPSATTGGGTSPADHQHDDQDGTNGMHTSGTPVATLQASSFQLPNLQLPSFQLPSFHLHGPQMHGAGISGSDVDFPVLALRLVLLLSTAAVAGIGLARSLTDGVGTRTRVFAWVASGIAVLTTAASLPVLHLDLAFAIAQLVLTLAVPALLRWPNPPAWTGFALLLLVLVETSLGRTGPPLLADALYVATAAAWLGAVALIDPGGRPETRVRITPIALASGTALVVVGLVRLFTSGLAFDRRIYGSPLGLALLALVLLPLLATVLATVLALPRRRPTALGGAARFAGIGAVALTFLTWSALPALPQPRELPAPGVPLLAQAPLAGQQTPVLVTPHRPGPNLVHFPEKSGHDLTVQVGGGEPVKATPRPGSEGTWAEVELPPGRADLVVHRSSEQDGSEGEVEVDTGEDPTPVADSTGPQGPECASSALGGLVAGQRRPLDSCPSQRLSQQDADALRGLVHFLGTRPTPGISIAGDRSPRSEQAAAVIAESAAREHLPVNTSEPGNALIVTGGWERAATRLDSVSEQQAQQHAYGAGVHLAPWLMHAPVVNRALTAYLPLTFNPRDHRALHYGVNVEHDFGGAAPSKAGFDSWLSARGDHRADAPTLYASAQVSAMPMNTAAGGGGHMGGGHMGGGDHAGGGNAGGRHGDDYPGQWVSGGTIVPVTGALG